jgi:hypothetical protein
VTVTENRSLITLRPEVELFARLAPDLRLEADKVESRLRQELDLDVVADEERGIDLESDLAVDAFQNVPG